MKLIATLAAAVMLAQPVLAEEVLHTAVDPNFPPMASMNLSGKMEGFNIDLGHALAKQMGVKIDIKGVNFAGIIPGMNAGTYDFILAPVTATKERADKMLFTEGYIFTALEFGHKKGTPTLTKPEDLKGKTVVANKGSNYDQWAQANAAKYGFTALTVDTFTSATDAVMSGRANYQLGGNANIRYAATKVPGFEPGYVLSDTRLHWALAVAKNKAALRDKLDVAIECLKKKGEIAAISKKWLGVTPAPTDAENTIFPGYGVPGLPGYDPTKHEDHC